MISNMQLSIVVIATFSCMLRMRSATSSAWQPPFCNYLSDLAGRQPLMMRQHQMDATVLCTDTHMPSALVASDLRNILIVSRQRLVPSVVQGMPGLLGLLVLTYAYRN